MKYFLLNVAIMGIQSGMACSMRNCAIDSNLHFFNRGLIVLQSIWRAGREWTSGEIESTSEEISLRIYAIY